MFEEAEKNARDMQKDSDDSLDEADAPLSGIVRPVLPKVTLKDVDPTKFGLKSFDRLFEDVRKDDVSKVR